MSNTQSILNASHGKRTQLNYFISGFVDGEGCFSVAILKHPTKEKSWIINPCFQVYQHQKHREVLELCKEVFGAGTIYRKSGIHPVLNFSIDSTRNIIEKVIPFFDRYPLITKREAYRTFREIVLAIQNREHLSKEGFERLVRLAYSMNQQGKGRRRTLEEILGLSEADIVSESSETNTPNNLKIELMIESNPHGDMRGIDQKIDNA